MNIHKDLPLSDILWYRIGGIAKVVLDMESIEDVSNALKFVETEKPQKILVIGLGSNMLVSDEYFDGVVLRFVRTPSSSSSITVQDDVVEAFAGETLDDVIQTGFEHSLIGFEWAGGLPGTVGASVRGNVGAFGGEIKDSVLSVQVIDMNDPQKGVFTLTNEELNFVYRGSKVKKEKNLLVVSAKFQLKKADEPELEAAKEKYHKNISYREQNHPLEYPSCGSTFKNIVDKKGVEEVLSVYPELKEKVETKWHGKVSIASIIEKLGFIGFKIGSAQVSQKHANFIVNLGGATFSDVYKIIQAIREEFYDVFGFEPEVEAEIVR